MLVIMLISLATLSVFVYLSVCRLRVCQDKIQKEELAVNELRKKARSRVFISSEADLQKMTLLEKLLDEAAPPGEGPKIENSIFSAIQYRGDWIFHGNSTKVLTDEGLIIDPLELIILLQDKAKLQEAMTAKKYSTKRQIQRYLGENEGETIAKVKFNLGK